MYSKNLLPALSLLVISCQAKNNSDTSVKKSLTTDIGTIYKDVASIPLPDGYTRIEYDTNSFAIWLRNVSLKKDKTVYLFNGNKKDNQLAQFAVLDITTGDKNLQQCADAIIRLRAEYLFSSKQFSAILFTDNANKPYQFLPPYSKDHLHNYLQTVFGMCGSASLSKQLRRTNINDIQPGDVFIRGGFPGHAEIVMDVAKNSAGEKVFLLAQSYMPAQDIHIVVNPLDSKLSPWYKTADNIISPEYAFTKEELKTW